MSTNKILECEITTSPSGSESGASNLQDLLAKRKKWEIRELDKTMHSGVQASVVMSWTWEIPPFQELDLRDTLSRRVEPEPNRWTISCLQLGLAGRLLG